MVKILIVDSNHENCELLQDALYSENTQAIYALSVVEAIDCLVKGDFQLVILDLSLSETDGLRLLGVIRELRPMPIMALSSKDSTEQTVQAFSLGADDVLKKPYELEECLARAQNLLRRVSTEPGTGGPGYTLVSGRDLIINPLTHRAYQRGEPLALTRREFDLLSFLVSHGGQVLSRDQLLNSVWPNDASFASEEAVRYQIRQLRKKLGTPDDYIETVWGVGYRFNEK